MAETPLTRYRRDLSHEKILPDAAQAKAVDVLQDLYSVLVEEETRRRRPLYRLLASVRLVSREPLIGVYLWGGVGRGKTYLMDVFFDTLPFENKMRTHFHRFMRRVHGELKKLKDRPNPLETVAESLARDARVICFDEFFVVDIADAMILGNLLKALFERGVTLVATSNIVPGELYRDGLQRARFLPAIELLKRHTRVVNVDGGVDYRLRALERANLYYTPLGEGATHAMVACFQRLVADENSVRRDTTLTVESRPVTALREADDVVWFHFAALCDGPRSQNDYIELAREYHAVLVSDVPIFDGRNDDQARRFIYLVDEFYDRNVKLVMSAARPIEHLYEAGKLAFEFKRTISRVLEMQSHDYLARAHRP